MTAVVLVPEFLTSRRCPFCRRTGQEAEDYLKIDPVTRLSTCPCCHMTEDRDVVACLNIAAVVFQWLEDGTRCVCVTSRVVATPALSCVSGCCLLCLPTRRPDYLDEPYAAKYSKASDAADWSTKSSKAAAAARTATAPNVSTPGSRPARRQASRPSTQGSTAHPLASSRGDWTLNQSSN